MLWAGGLQLYLRFAWQWHWPLESDLIIPFSYFWVAQGTHLLTITLDVKQGLLVSSWILTVISQNVLLWLDQSCTPLPAVLWCDLVVPEPHYESSLMIYSVYTSVHLYVYLSGVISLFFFFLFIANNRRCDKWLALASDICVPFWSLLH